MSYDITFWKAKPSATVDPQAAYERLNRNDPPDELEELPLPDIIGRLKDAFPDFDPTEESPDVKFPHGSMEISYTAKSFRFDFRPPSTGGKGRIWSLMSGFGCVCYDPQTGKLYDRNNPPEYKDLGTDLSWLLDPGWMREANSIQSLMTRSYSHVAREILPKLLLFCFIISCVLAAVITTFVYFIRWVISLFAVAV
ncbi:MAG TPA: hypothetical protein VFB66_01710 [Tepidisphaeraceae bacterium]|nr:hypothetical protein [Tepidisphaeraceae bacterium]